jgi:hypothetical protein
MSHYTACRAITIDPDTGRSANCPIGYKCKLSSNYTKNAGRLEDSKILHTGPYDQDTESCDYFKDK